MTGVQTCALPILTHQQSGSSGLFDALEQAITYVSAFSSDNKSITLFVRNKDDGLSRLNLNEIISLAQVNNIKINLIWLIHDPVNVDSKTLRRLASKTGGFTVYMSRISQSSTVFLGLSKLLRMEMNFYRVSVKVSLDVPILPAYYDAGMYLYYYISETFIASYVPLYIERPLP